jgi:hypothetical protein
MKLREKAGARLLVVAVLSLTAAPSRAEGTQYEVTVTNLTRGQSFTPILVATHEAGVTLFTLGEAASAELAILAEAGDVGPLATALASRPEVLDVESSTGLLGPGKTVRITVDAGGTHDHVSVAAMLIPTNDGFFAVNGAAGPRAIGKTVSFLSPAYDAGSEFNDENCASIPGPPGVCGGEGVSAPAESDEGYVHINAGIHGITGELDPAVYDWRNPVAMVRVRRVN